MFPSFSRKLIWLRLSATNRDPKVVARYYLEAVEDTKGWSNSIID